MYCTICRKSLTKDFTSACDAEFAMVHGVEKLPAKCPFCSFPARIEDPMSDNPKVGCQMWDSVCPIGRQLFTLGQWELAKPEVSLLDQLAKRWTNKPEFAKALRGLQRTLKQYRTGRWRGDNPS